MTTQVQIKLDVIEEYDENTDLTRVVLSHPILQGELFFLYDQCDDRNFKSKMLKSIETSLTKDIDTLSEAFKDLKNSIKNLKG